MTSTYDTQDTNTWPRLPPLAARDAFVTWLGEKNPYAAHGDPKYALAFTTVREHGRKVGGLLDTLHAKGEEALHEEIAQAAEKYEARARDTSNYNRIIAWREFVAFMQCSVMAGEDVGFWGQRQVGHWLLPMRYPEHQIDLGDYFAATSVGHCIRVLLARFSPHTLSSLPVGRALLLLAGKADPPLWSDDARGALAHLIRWAWARPMHRPMVRDFRHQFALPATPGADKGLAPSLIADIGGRLTDTVMPTESVEAVLAMFTEGQNGAILPRRTANPEELNIEQIPPAGTTIEAFMKSYREDVRRKRAERLPPLTTRENGPEKLACGCIAGTFEGLPARKAGQGVRDYVEALPEGKRSLVLAHLSGECGGRLVALAGMVPVPAAGAGEEATTRLRLFGPRVVEVTDDIEARFRTLVPEEAPAEKNWSLTIPPLREEAEADEHRLFEPPILPHDP